MPTPDSNVRPSPSLRDAANTFLALRRIAVAGVSRKGDAAANLIFRKLRETGHEVFAVNPKATEVEGAPCYPNLAAVPGGVDGVVIATPPAAAVQIVRECGALGIRHVWMHRSLGKGSVDDEAVRLCGERGISLIPGSCPMMFCDPVDPAHKCLRWLLHVTGSEARPSGFA